MNHLISKWMTMNTLLLLVHPSEDNWVAANKEPVDKNTYRVKGLPTGEKLLFRVVAMNIAGRSPPCTMKQSVTIREIMGQTHTHAWTHTHTLLHRPLTHSIHSHFHYFCVDILLCLPPCLRVPKDPPASPAKNQVHQESGREDQPGHPLPGLNTLHHTVVTFPGLETGLTSC